MNDPLTKEQINELHQMLLALKEEIARMLDISSEASKPVDLEEPIGRISRMDAIHVQSIAKANREKLVLRSRQVDASLNDFRNNRYGICRMCNKPIGYQRLKARPESPFCLVCQTEIEKRHSEKNR